MAVELTVVLRFEKEEDIPDMMDFEWAFECDVVDYDWEEV